MLPEPPAERLRAVLSQLVVGGEEERLQLLDLGWGSLVGVKESLERERAVLPELEEPPQPKPLRRQPAFIVALSATAAALVTFVAIVVVQLVVQAPTRVEAVHLTDLGDNLLLQWDGPDVPYAVAMTGGDIDGAVDLSAMIKGGREVWVPKRTAAVSTDACFVVLDRAVSEREQLVSDTERLAEAGGARICVSEAERG
ncbi:hypothetical protein SAMN06295974_3129 [Plantibacter flavus]|uniref:Uncharacterized protein n=1 Tax=Plantibacter flavus TaxID=150123 RepID=A0A3N2C400_9MICO|nr:hypothetical protein EDD42_2324 [Plantibacter flavus]SMG42590.1 hypothetical protein SAMN06295974_3129 [Plantibacter flavus]